jgi:hypothetical protein
LQELAARGVARSSSPALKQNHWCDLPAAAALGYDVTLVADNHSTFD